jgi:guanylate kinase
MQRPLLVVIGPSASGKSTVMQTLERRGIVRVHPTWTTRPRRPDERVADADHRFVSEAWFDELERTGFFLGAVALPGLRYRYGLPRITPDREGAIDTVIARAPFLDRLAAAFPALLVYQIEDTRRRAKQRLRARGGDAREYAVRLDAYVAEASAGRQRADRVFVNSGSPDALAEAIASALHDDLTLEHVR